MNIVHNTFGLIHLIVSIAAVILGTMALFMKKGTKVHRKIGYAYATSMLIVIGTAFCIYRLMGTFSPFHIAAVISLVTLMLGMIPVLRRKPGSNWLGQHMSFMYYSVIGLYAAFFSEVMVRIPGTPFAVTVGVGTFVTFFIAIVIFAKKRTTWMKNHGAK